MEVQCAGKGLRNMPVRVLHLDETVHSFQLSVHATGQELFASMVDRIHLLESDYFDLEYVNEESLKCWLDHDKPILRQVASSKDLLFRFGVKFYTPFPNLLEEDFTRYLFALQIKRDLINGTLLCSENTAALLASYIAQAEIGDFIEEEYLNTDYLNGLKLLHEPSEERLIRVMEFHKAHIGLSPSEADLALLDTARKVEFYGVRLHFSRNHEGLGLNLAVSHLGILVFRSLLRINTFSWAKIRKLSFKRKRLLVKLQSERFQDTIDFIFDTRDECKQFWKNCIEHHTFFRCSIVERVASTQPRSAQSGSSFRYTGRTQQELVEYVQDHVESRISFERPSAARRAYSTIISGSSYPGRRLQSGSLQLRSSSADRRGFTLKSTAGVSLSQTLRKPNELKRARSEGPPNSGIPADEDASNIAKTILPTSGYVTMTESAGSARSTEATGVTTATTSASDTLDTLMWINETCRRMTGDWSSCALHGNDAEPDTGTERRPRSKSATGSPRSTSVSTDCRPLPNPDGTTEPTEATSTSIQDDGPMTHLLLFGDLTPATTPGDIPITSSARVEVRSSTADQVDVDGTMESVAHTEATTMTTTAATTSSFMDTTQDLLSEMNRAMFVQDMVADISNLVGLVTSPLHQSVLRETERLGAEAARESSQQAGAILLSTSLSSTQPDLLSQADHGTVARNPMDSRGSVGGDGMLTSSLHLTGSNLVSYGQAPMAEQSGVNTVSSFLGGSSSTIQPFQATTDLFSDLDLSTQNALFILPTVTQYGLDINMDRPNQQQSFHTYELFDAMSSLMTETQTTTTTSSVTTPLGDSAPTYGVPTSRYGREASSVVGPSTGESGTSWGEPIPHRSPYTLESGGPMGEMGKYEGTVMGSRDQVTSRHSHGDNSWSTGPPRTHHGSTAPLASSRSVTHIRSELGPSKSSTHSLIAVEHASTRVQPKPTKSTTTTTSNTRVHARSSHDRPTDYGGLTDSPIAGTPLDHPWSSSSSDSTTGVILRPDKMESVTSVSTAATGATALGSSQNRASHKPGCRHSMTSPRDTPSPRGRERLSTNPLPLDTLPARPSHKATALIHTCGQAHPLSHSIPCGVHLTGLEGARGVRPSHGPPPPPVTTASNTKHRYHHDQQQSRLQQQQLIQSNEEAVPRATSKRSHAAVPRTISPTSIPPVDLLPSTDLLMMPDGGMSAAAHMLEEVPYVVLRRPRSVDVKQYQMHIQRQQHQAAVLASAGYPVHPGAPFYTDPRMQHQMASMRHGPPMVGPGNYNPYYQHHPHAMGLASPGGVMPTAGMRSGSSGGGTRATPAAAVAASGSSKRSAAASGPRMGGAAMRSSTTDWSRQMPYPEMLHPQYGHPHRHSAYPMMPWGPAYGGMPEQHQQQLQQEAMMSVPAEEREKRKAKRRLSKSRTEALNRDEAYHHRSSHAMEMSSGAQSQATDAGHHLHCVHRQQRVPPRMPDASADHASSRHRRTPDSTGRAQTTTATSIGSAVRGAEASQKRDVPSSRQKASPVRRTTATTGKQPQQYPRRRIPSYESSESRPRSAVMSIPTELDREAEVPYPVSELVHSTGRHEGHSAGRRSAKPDSRPRHHQHHQHHHHPACASLIGRAHEPPSKASPPASRKDAERSSPRERPTPATSSNQRDRQRRDTAKMGTADAGPKRSADRPKSTLTERDVVLKDTRETIEKLREELRSAGFQVKGSTKSISVADGDTKTGLQKAGTSSSSTVTQAAKSTTVTAKVVSTPEVDVEDKTRQKNQISSSGTKEKRDRISADKGSRETSTRTPDKNQRLPVETGRIDKGSDLSFGGPPRNPIYLDSDSDQGEEAAPTGSQLESEVNTVTEDTKPDTAAETLEAPTSESIQPGVDLDDIDIVRTDPRSHSPSLPLSYLPSADGEDDTDASLGSQASLLDSSFAYSVSTGSYCPDCEADWDSDGSRSSYHHRHHHHHRPHHSHHRYQSSHDRYNQSHRSCHCHACRTDRRHHDHHHYASQHRPQHAGHYHHSHRERDAHRHAHGHRPVRHHSERPHHATRHHRNYDAPPETARPTSHRHHQHPRSASSTNKRGALVDLSSSDASELSWTNTASSDDDGDGGSLSGNEKLPANEREGDPLQAVMTRLVAQEKHLRTELAKHRQLAQQLKEARQETQRLMEEQRSAGTLDRSGGAGGRGKKQAGSEASSSRRSRTSPSQTSGEREKGVEKADGKETQVRVSSKSKPHVHGEAGTKKHVDRSDSTKKRSPATVRRSVHARGHVMHSGRRAKVVHHVSSGSKTRKDESVVAQTVTDVPVTTSIPADNASAENVSDDLIITNTVALDKVNLKDEPVEATAPISIVTHEDEQSATIVDGKDPTGTDKPGSDTVDALDTPDGLKALSLLPPVPEHDVVSFASPSTADPLSDSTIEQSPEAPAPPPAAPPLEFCITPKGSPVKRLTEANTRGEDGQMCEMDFPAEQVDQYSTINRLPTVLPEQPSDGDSEYDGTRALSMLTEVIENAMASTAAPEDDEDGGNASPPLPLPPPPSSDRSSLTHRSESPEHSTQTSSICDESHTSEASMDTVRAANSPRAASPSYEMSSSADSSTDSASEGSEEIEPFPPPPPPQTVSTSSASSVSSGESSNSSMDGGYQLVPHSSHHMFARSLDEVIEEESTGGDLDMEADFEPSNEKDEPFYEALTPVTEAPSDEALAQDEEAETQEKPARDGIVEVEPKEGEGELQDDIKRAASPVCDGLQESTVDGTSDLASSTPGVEEICTYSVHYPCGMDGEQEVGESIDPMVPVTESIDAEITQSDDLEPNVATDIGDEASKLDSSSTIMRDEEEDAASEAISEIIQTETDAPPAEASASSDPDITTDTAAVSIQPDTTTLDAATEPTDEPEPEIAPDPHQNP